MFQLALCIYSMLEEYMLQAGVNLDMQFLSNKNSETCSWSEWDILGSITFVHRKLHMYSHNPSHQATYIYAL